ncbi:MAG: FkbM family methyltransferase [Chromatiales bacterium]|nr:FkbM family methyltransferase [Chromatiales bacterium]
MASRRGTIGEFLEDIEPFFYGRRLTYVDVGAYKGEVFKAINASRLRIRESHLIEPNPESCAELRETLQELVATRNCQIHQLAVGADSRAMKLVRAQSMTKALAPAGDAGAVGGNVFEATAVSLDELSKTFTERRISLLKIDVEGSELDVLAGAQELLSGSLVDVVYVEVGMSAGSTQQCYYRDVEDALARHQYRIFGLYEPMYEWTEDSPFLRRVNVAFMSAAFARNNPYSVTRELFRAQQDLATARSTAKAEAEKLRALETQLAAARKSEAAALEKLQRLPTLEADISKLQDAARDREEELEAELTRQRAALQARELEIEAAVATHRDAERGHDEAVAAELAALRELLQSRERELEESREAHRAEARRARELADEVATGALETGRLEAERRRLEQLLHGTEGRMIQLVARNETLQQLRTDAQSRIDRLESTLVEQRRRLAEFTAVRPRLEQEAADRAAEVEELATKLAEARARLDADAMAAAEASRQLARTQGDAATLRERLAKAQTTIGEQAARYSTQTDRVRRLERKNAQLAEQLQDAKKAVKASRKDAATVTTALETERRKRERLLVDRDLGEEMAREVLQLYDTSLGREHRAQARAQRAAQMEALIQRKLPYRLGRSLLKNLRSPLRWLWIPVALYRANGKYRQEKAQGLLDSPPPSEKTLRFRDDQLTLVAKTRWQTTELPATQLELWLTVLGVSRAGSVRFELQTQDAAVLAELRTQLSAALGAAASVDTPGAAQLELPPGESVRLLGSVASQARLDLRKLKGVPCAVKLELVPEGVRTQRAPVRPPPPAPTPARSNHPAKAGSAPATKPAADMAPATPRPATPAKTQPVRRATPAPGVSLPKPMKSTIIWQAAQIIDSGHVDAGIEFAETHARPFVRPAVSLLKANRDVADKKRWLGHVNDYLRQFDIAPLTLEPGDGHFFERFSTASLEAVERGPLVSVIMPTFNAQATLRFAVRSVLKQTWRPLELIIVDDCSDDQTFALAKELARGDSRVRVLRNSVNVGPYVSKNLALSVARGEFVTGHDSDDWAHPHRIERHVTHMLASGGALKASMGRMLRLDAQGVFCHFAKEGKTSDDGVLRDAAISCMFQANLLREKLGFWDCVRFGADSELIERSSRLLGAGFERLRQMGMMCLDGEGSLTSDPVHGVSKQHGISPTRRFYRDQWTAWHRTVTLDEAYLPFPHEPRRFEAPEVALVPHDAVLKVVQSLKAQA